MPTTLMQSFAPVIDTIFESQQSQLCNVRLKDRCLNPARTKRRLSVKGWKSSHNWNRKLSSLEGFDPACQQSAGLTGNDDET
ncbi:MAG: hypothetical protein ABI977_17880 [Acidobacteriota bacterium]